MTAFILKEEFWCPQKVGLARNSLRTTVSCQINAPFPQNCSFHSSTSPNATVALLMRPDGLITFGGAYNEGGNLKVHARDACDV